MFPLHPSPPPNFSLVHRTRIDVSPATSYQRLLVHRCSTYYRLAPENDPTSKGITVYQTADSKVYVSYYSHRSLSHATSGPAVPIGVSQSLHRLKKPPSLPLKSCAAFNRNARNSNLPHNPVPSLARMQTCQTWNPPRLGVMRLVVAASIKST